MPWTPRFRRYAALPLVSLVVASLGVALAQPPAARMPLVQLGSSAFRGLGSVRSGDLLHVSISKDGKKLLTASTLSNSVCLWDLATGKPVREVTLSDRLHDFAASPDGKWLATSELLFDKKERFPRQVIRLRDGATWAVVRSLDRGSVGSFVSRPATGFLPYGRGVVLGDIGRHFNPPSWDILTGALWSEKRPFREGQGWALHAPDSDRRVELVSPGNELVVSSRAGGPPTRLLTGLKDEHSMRAIAPDGLAVVLVAQDSSWIELVDTRTGKARRLRLDDATHFLDDVAFTPDGKHLLGVEVPANPWRWVPDEKPAPGHVVVWEVATGKVVARWPTPGNAGSLRISADGKVVTMATEGMPTWDFATGKLIRPVSDADLLQAQRTVGGAGMVLTLSEDGPARLWDGQTGAFLRAFRHPDAWPCAGAVHPEGKLVATAAHDDTIRVWDATTGELRLRLPGHGKRNSWWSGLAVRFSPGGKTLYSFGGDFSFRETNLATGKTSREWDVRRRGTPLEDQALSKYLEESPLSVWFPTISDDGARVAYSYHSHKPVFLFDVDTGRPHDRLQLPGLSLCEPTFTPDGRHLLTLTRTPWDGFGGIEAISLWKPESPVLTCWDVATDEILWMELVPLADGALAVAPDVRRVAMAASDSERSLVEFRSLDDGRLLDKLDQMPGPPRHLTYLPDGKSLAVTLPDGSVQVHAVPAAKPQP